MFVMLTISGHLGALNLIQYVGLHSPDFGYTDPQHDHTSALTHLEQPSENSGPRFRAVEDPLTGDILYKRC